MVECECFVFLITCFPFSVAFIFDKFSLVDTNAIFKKNDCFKTSNDLTVWFTKATSDVVYKRFLRAGFNESLEYNPPLKVNVSMDMNSMASVDEISSEYKIILKINLEWIDQRLINNCSKAPITMALNAYNLERIWSPKLGLPNTKNPDNGIIQGETTLLLGQWRTDGYVRIRFK